MESVKPTPQSFFKIEMANYVRPEIKEVQGRKWVLNGDKNSFYNTIVDAYNGSPTNSAIIDSYSQFIYGKGLTSKDKVSKATQWNEALSIFSKKDFSNENIPSNQINQHFSSSFQSAYELMIKIINQKQSELKTKFSMNNLFKGNEIKDLIDLEFEKTE